MLRLATIGVFLLTLAALPGTGHAEYWSYVKDNGTRGFADKEKKVPARYRDRAVRHADKALSEYERFTLITDPARPAEREETAALPQVASAPPADADPTPRLLIRASPRVSISMPLPEGDEPIRVERSSYGRWRDGEYRFYTIVRQGDRVIREIEH